MLKNEQEVRMEERREPRSGGRYTMTPDGKIKKNDEKELLTENKKEKKQDDKKKGGE